MLTEHGMEASCKLLLRPDKVEKAKRLYFVKYECPYIRDYITMSAIKIYELEVYTISEYNYED